MPPLALASIVLASGLAPGASAAPPTAVTVQGAVVPPAAVEAPPLAYAGFVPPTPNPILPLRQYDPLPECIVYLDGAAAPPEAAQPPHGPVTWQLGNHAFMPPILPVISGSQVEISNVGQETHVLYSPTQPGLIPKEPIGRDGSRTVTASGKDLAIPIQAKGSPHLIGRIVPLPTRYFARPDRNGKFKIENVPAGRWTVKVWYRDGWLGLPAKTIDVPGKGDVRIDLTSDALAGKPTTPMPGPN
jgi:hypothetical protein